jgi:phosphatidylglycerophosphatase C
LEKIFIFDFDGTIIEGDSLIKFSYFSLGLIQFFKYWISVIILIPFYSRSDLKQMYYSNFNKFNLDDFNNLCLDFYDQKLRKLIKKSFVDFIKNINEDSKFVIVSASISNYLKPWCDEMGFDLISTELEVVNEKLTGKFSTPNCNGEEKVRRIKEKYNLLEYDEIHVFGNSSGDFPMLELGTHKYYKFFK